MQENLIFLGDDAHTTLCVFEDVKSHFFGRKSEYEEKSEENKQRERKSDVMVKKCLKKA